MSNQRYGACYGAVMAHRTPAEDGLRHKRPFLGKRPYFCGAPPPVHSRFMAHVMAQTAHPGPQPIGPIVQRILDHATTGHPS